MPKCRLSYTKIYANIQKNGMPRTKTDADLYLQAIKKQHNLHTWHAILHSPCRLHTALLALSCSRALIFALANVELIAHRKAYSALSRSTPKRLAHGAIKHGKALA